LDAIVQREGIEHHVRNLVAVLIDHRRVQFSGDGSSSKWKKELDARMGFAEAQITSARELGDAEKAGRSKRRSKKPRARKCGRTLDWMRPCSAVRWSE
jgi:F0F1-type ATP synthase delta subunit